jgi:hypothetical protein
MDTPAAAAEQKPGAGSKRRSTSVWYQKMTPGAGGGSKPTAAKATLAEAQALLISGELTESSLVWASGMGSEWLPLEQCATQPPFSALQTRVHRPLAQMVSLCNERWRLELPASGTLSYRDEGHHLQWSSPERSTERPHAGPPPKTQLQPETLGQMLISRAADRQPTAREEVGEQEQEEQEQEKEDEIKNAARSRSRQDSEHRETPASDADMGGHPGSGGRRVKQQQPSAHAEQRRSPSSSSPQQRMQPTPQAHVVTSTSSPQLAKTASGGLGISFGRSAAAAGRPMSGGCNNDGGGGGGDDDDDDESLRAWGSTSSSGPDEGAGELGQQGQQQQRERQRGGARRGGGGEVRDSGGGDGVMMPNKTPRTRRGEALHREAAAQRERRETLGRQAAAAEAGVSAGTRGGGNGGGKGGGGAHVEGLHSRYGEQQARMEMRRREAEAEKLRAEEDACRQWDADRKKAGGGAGRQSGAGAGQGHRADSIGERSRRILIDREIGRKAAEEEQLRNLFVPRGGGSKGGSGGGEGRGWSEASQSRSSSSAEGSEGGQRQRAAPTTATPQDYVISSARALSDYQHSAVVGTSPTTPSVGGTGGGAPEVSRTIEFDEYVAAAAMTTTTKPTTAPTTTGQLAEARGGNDDSDFLPDSQRAAEAASALPQSSPTAAAKQPCLEAPGATDDGGDKTYPQSAPVDVELSSTRAPAAEGVAAELGQPATAEPTTGGQVPVPAGASSAPARAKRRPRRKKGMFGCCGAPSQPETSPPPSLPVAPAPVAMAASSGDDDTAATPRGLRRMMLNANQLNQAGDLQGAVSVFTAIVSRADELALSEQAAVYDFRGQCRERLGDKPGALEDFDMAISSVQRAAQQAEARGGRGSAGPAGMWGLYFHRGRLLYRLGRLEEADADLLAAAKMPECGGAARELYRRVRYQRTLGGGSARRSPRRELSDQQRQTVDRLSSPKDRTPASPVTRRSAKKTVTAVTAEKTASHASGAGSSGRAGATAAAARTGAPNFRTSQRGRRGGADGAATDLDAAVDRIFGSFAKPTEARQAFHRMQRAKAEVGVEELRRGLSREYSIDLPDAMVERVVSLLAQPGSLVLVDDDFAYGQRLARFVVLRRKIRGASCMAKGEAAADWEPLFQRMDVGGRGSVNADEFRRGARREAKISPKQIPDSELLSLFKSLCAPSSSLFDKSGFVAFWQEGLAWLGLNREVRPKAPRRSQRTSPSSAGFKKQVPSDEDNPFQLSPVSSAGPRSRSPQPSPRARASEQGQRAPSRLQRPSRQSHVCSGDSVALSFAQLGASIAVRWESGVSPTVVGTHALSSWEWQFLDRVRAIQTVQCSPRLYGVTRRTRHVGCAPDTRELMPIVPSCRRR